MATGSVQPSPSPQYTSPPITIILTVILLVFFFVGFFSIYFCRCFMHNLLYTWHLRNSPNDTPVGGTTAAPARGLDPSIVQSFPTFNYSNVKDYRKEKYGLECAICLIEFEDIDVLRLLTPCCHVFHQECIDLWLESHKTCPVCRRNLDSPMQSPVKCSTYTNNIMHDINENEEVGDSFSITIKDDENEDERRDSGKGERVASSANEQDDHEKNKVEKFSRSNSTGHSIVLRNIEGEDRFTLRLPEHVKSNIIKGHNSSRSWTTFGEYKTKNYYGNIGLKEVSGSSGGDINKV